MTESAGWIYRNHPWLGEIPDDSTRVHAKLEANQVCTRSGTHQWLQSPKEGMTQHKAALRRRKGRRAMRVWNYGLAGQSDGSTRCRGRSDDARARKSRTSGEEEEGRPASELCL